MSIYYVQADSSDEKEYEVTITDDSEDCNCPARVICRHIDMVHRQIADVQLSTGDTTYREVYEFLPSKSSRFQPYTHAKGKNYVVVGRTIYYSYLLPVRGFTVNGVTFRYQVRGHIGALRQLMKDHGIPQKVASRATMFL